MKKVLISLVLLITTICAYAADWQAYEEKGFFIDSFNVSIFSTNIGFLLCVTIVIKIY